MADDFVILCKSYRQDVRRVQRLAASLRQHNTENLPFVVVVPAADVELFATHLADSGARLVSDEDVVRAHPRAQELDLLGRYLRTPGGLTQQVVKSEAWRLLQCRAYLCIDSDTVFIRPFGRGDFMDGSGNVYTVFAQGKELFQLAIDQGHADVWRSFEAQSRQVQARLGRSGPCFGYGPFPVLWSAQVWRDLSERHLAPQGLTLWDAIEDVPSEAHWYGEALLRWRSVPFIPVDPLCRCYHYDWQYRLLRQAGETEDKLATLYLCVVYQSNWDEALDLVARRSRLSALARRLKRWWH